MEATTARTDEGRVEVQRFFAQHFGDIADSAVPKADDDRLYNPAIRVIRDESGQVIAAALANRPMIAAGAVMMGGKLPDGTDYGPVLDEVYQLDMLAVAPGHRGKGLSRILLSALEADLVGRGARVLFGCVTPEMDARALRAFYAAAGFTVLEGGQPLPQFRGRPWVGPLDGQPAFYFYRQIPRP